LQQAPKKVMAKKAPSLGTWNFFAAETGFGAFCP
jgi:hypothetical protein